MEHPTQPGGRDGTPSGREVPSQRKNPLFPPDAGREHADFLLSVFWGYSRVICWKKARARSRSWVLGWPLARPPTSLKGPKVS